MIEPKELRIGNLLQLNPEKQWVGRGDGLTIVESISEKGINYTNYPESGLAWQELDGNDRCCPIPLTSEWLERFGFEKQPGCFRIMVFEGYVSIKLRDSTKAAANPLILEIDSCAMPLWEIKHVHQLQNLYFALTGQELDIRSNGRHYKIVRQLPRDSLV